MLKQWKSPLQQRPPTLQACAPWDALEGLSAERKLGPLCSLVKNSKLFPVQEGGGPGRRAFTLTGTLSAQVCWLCDDK